MSIVCVCAAPIFCSISLKTAAQLLTRNVRAKRRHCGRALSCQSKEVLLNLFKLWKQFEVEKQCSSCVLHDHQFASTKFPIRQIFPQIKGGKRFIYSNITNPHEWILSFSNLINRFVTSSYNNELCLMSVMHLSSSTCLHVWETGKYLNVDLKNQPSESPLYESRLLVLPSERSVNHIKNLPLFQKYATL